MEDKNLSLENLDGEIWKDIDGYNGDYQVSNYGRIKSFKGKEEIILKQYKTNSGYLYISLYKNRKPKKKLIHILLFETFNNYNLKENECIHHIDKNPLNNNLNNFQLMCISEHISFHNSGNKNPMFGIHKYGNNAPNFGNKHSEKTKKLISEKNSGENGPMFGKKHSEKSKKLMSENHADFKGKNHPNFGKKCPKISKRMSGENNLNHILTEKNIPKIRKLCDEGILTQKEIGKMFGVHQTIISAIKNNRIWKKY